MSSEVSAGDEFNVEMLKAELREVFLRHNVGLAVLGGLAGSVDKEGAEQGRMLLWASHYCPDDFPAEWKERLEGIQNYLRDALVAWCVEFRSGEVK